MITFRVLEQKYGWTIHLSQGTSTHFRSRELAIREANLMAENLRRHGASARVVVQDFVPPSQATWTELVRADRSASQIVSLTLN